MPSARRLTRCARGRVIDPVADAIVAPRGSPRDGRRGPIRCAARRRAGHPCPALGPLCAYGVTVEV
jgi:hypothetical protein